jgi:hypothetical protein
MAARAKAHQNTFDNLLLSHHDFGHLGLNGLDAALKRVNGGGSIHKK